MGRRGGERGGPSTRVFVRPMTMLAVGLAGGMAMWWILTADDAPAGSADAHRPMGQAHARSASDAARAVEGGR
jgi:hypothetical protein